MGRFAFVLLIVSFPWCFATRGSVAQEAENQPVQTPSTSDVGAERNGSVAVDGQPSETRLEKTPKSKAGLLEEILSSPLNYILLLVMCFYVYLMFVRPRNSRQEKKLLVERMNNLKKNDRVVTTSGIHGIVSNINTDAGTVTLRVDENSNAKLTIDRDSIRSVAS